MSSSHHAQVHLARRSPPNVTKVPLKAPRSAPSSKTLVPPKITIKPAKGNKHLKDDDDNDTFQEDDDDDDMASSFLQFWFVAANTSHLTSYPTAADWVHSAMCEKQIVVPNSSILYCSERSLIPPPSHLVSY